MHKLRNKTVGRQGQSETKTPSQVMGGLSQIIIEDQHKENIITEGMKQ